MSNSKRSFPLKWCIAVVFVGISIAFLSSSNNNNMLGGVVKSVQKLLVGNLIRLPAFQRNLAFPTDSFVGKFVTNKLLMKSNGPAIHEILSKMLANELESYPKDSTFLELGFGPGNAMMDMMDLYSDNFKTLEGVDPSSDMKTACMENLQKHDLYSNFEINLKTAYGHDMPHVQQEEIDFLFHANVVYFWKDMDETLQELHRVLKTDNGLMASMTTFQGVTSFDPDIFVNRNKNDYLKALDRNGFQVIREEPVGSSKDFAREMILVKKK